MITEKMIEAVGRARHRDKYDLWPMGQEERDGIIRDLTAALASNLADARTAGGDSQNTTAQVTKAVDVASESVAGRAPVAQGGETPRTDEVAWTECTEFTAFQNAEYVYADFARDLERELNAARAAAPSADEARADRFDEIAERAASEIAELRRDAARMRWWRENTGYLADQNGLPGIAFSFQVPLPVIKRGIASELMDAIADAAIAAEREDVEQERKP